jgi:N-acetylated-alpha-linked acidic dipeptidase
MKTIALLCGALAASLALSQTRDWEKQFRTIPDASRQREYMKRLTARPHHLGSPYGKEDAEWILARFKEWGLDAKIESFEVLFPTPKDRRVELVEPQRFVASLKEPALAEDPTSNQESEQVPAYNAYSIDGDVTAPLVYVNYGIPADYEVLERMGISVKGCIVLARYGASWRGIKPKVAAEHGAVGCLIYSDPHGDGYYRGDVYPHGAWRPKEGVQRGSVMDMPIHPGDPLTPFVGATENAKRLDIKDVDVFTKIPVLPISYADAQPLLAALGGPVAPEDWRGALPLTYKIGPGPAKVRLKAEFHWNRVKLYNVIGTLHGRQFPNEWIIRGNHHDAWVNGAEDPISGLVALMEEARAVAALTKQGWKPKRTLVYCAWDGEEQGLLGSTEWVETHADELKQKAAVYINTDATGRGFLYAAGSHSLEKFVNDVAKEINDPERNISVWKRLMFSKIIEPMSADERNKMRNKDIALHALGSGSDYTAFLDHLGIASLHLSFGGEDGGGIYHSAYDSFHWFTNFSDTNFAYGRALSQLCGTAVLRLADADVLPFNFKSHAATVATYLDELKSLAQKMREDIAEKNKMIEEGAFAAVADPHKAYVPPKVEEVPPFFNFTPLENAVATLKEHAQRYHNALEHFRAVKKPIPPSLNTRLIEAERRLTHPDGLPNRSWFTHQLYAPGAYTGYGVKTIPAVREALEQKQWNTVDGHIATVAKVLASEAELLISLASDLENAMK